MFRVSAFCLRTAVYMIISSYATNLIQPCNFPFFPPEGARCGVEVRPLPAVHGVHPGRFDTSGSVQYHPQSKEYYAACGGRLQLRLSDCSLL